jgi:hypothetical protein
VCELHDGVHGQDYSPSKEGRCKFQGKLLDEDLVKGKTMGVDASVEFHKYGKMEKCLRGIMLDGYVADFIHMFSVEMMRWQAIEVTPLVVFDGKSPPIKKSHEVRRVGKPEAQRLLKDFKEDKTGTLTISNKTLATPFELTEEMKHALCLRLQQLGITYVKAPSEADAQLSAMHQDGDIDFVKTVDSDLLIGRGCNVMFSSEVGSHSVSGVYVKAKDFFGIASSNTTSTASMTSRSHRSSSSTRSMVMLPAAAAVPHTSIATMPAATSSNSDGGWLKRLFTPSQSKVIIDINDQRRRQ